MDVDRPLTQNRLSVPKLVKSTSRTYQPADVLKEVEQLFLKNFGDDKHWFVGTVSSDVRGPFSGRCYFDIESEGLVVHASVPDAESMDLPVGTKVHLHGKITPRLKKDSIDATIVGNILSKVAPKPPKAIVLRRQIPVLSISDLLTTSKSHLVVLGTTRAINDLDTQLRNQGCYPGPFTRDMVRITSGRDVLEAVKRYALSCQGVLLVRGGGDEEGFRFWNDPEFIEEFLNIKVHFYLALGHADNQTDLDQFADQCFATPTEAGFVLAQALKVQRQVVDKTYPSRPSSKAPIEQQYSGDEGDRPFPLAVKIIIALVVFMTFAQMCSPKN